MLAAFQTILFLVIVISLVFAFGDKEADKRKPAAYTLIAATVITFLTFLLL
ncbi:hypothetical protein HWB91_gp48 [Bacillus phage vB_BboS-125]|uniref:Uncharacterized protein n=1 Tax=Bacillus phage vB_BboS-125 TaxID=2419618 RepID=A0A3G3BVY2_9CAUD|nr:hypothetical protein HWB91_gp48 [Bacillus phage vB_BboS-125]AYP68418.1 hypothetical protein BboS125_00049 [Bacillus phage vB_BboS-125]